MIRGARPLMLSVALLGLFLFPGAARTPPNVVLISIDTLRADHMGSYGYERPTTPRLDRLANTGVRFEQATAPATTTLPSHMSMFTSLYPEAHAVVDREDGVMRELAPSHVTLAQRLKQAGYETAAFVRNCSWLEPEFGFDRGFDSYRVVETDARRTNSEAIIPWLRQPRDKPFFLFVHYYDVHSDWERLPYDAPPPFDSMFTRGYRGSFDGCGEGGCATLHLNALAAAQKELPKEDLAYIEGLYDNGIAFTDSEAGRVLDTINELGMRGDTVVIVVSDHGEEFYEHGCLGHCSLYEDTLRVPWIISWPGRLAPAVVSTPVQTLDLMPTLLEILGLPASNGAQGVSRANEIRGLRGAGQPLFSTMGRRPAFSVRHGRWKLIGDFQTDDRELYDLQSDPGETRNLASRGTELARALSTLANASHVENVRIASSAPPTQHASTTHEQCEKHRGLGYRQ